MSEPGAPNVTAPSNPTVEREEAICSVCGQSFPPELDKCPDDGGRLIKLGARRDPLLGRVFEGRYEIRSQLGAGGMGTVYRGWQLSVDREVAIKVIDPRLSTDRVSVKRFLREARLSSRLNQPTIVNVYDFGQTDDGILYIAMELLRGKTLAHELAGLPIHVRRAAGLMTQLCDALDAAHGQDIVHRDLKPGNIFVLDDPPGRDLIKVLDFGLAKSLAQDGLSQVTKTDAMLGTPLYMAPEQIDGKPSDQRADLYAAGCIFFEMLAGRPPFVDQNMHAVLGKHMTEPPPPLPAAVPPSIATLIASMLAKQPDQRPSSAAEVRRTMQAALDGTTTVNSRPPPDNVARRLVTSDAPTATSIDAIAPTIDSNEAPRPRPRPRAWWRWVVVAAPLVAAASLIVVVMSTAQTTTQEPVQEQEPVHGPAIDPPSPARPLTTDAAVGDAIILVTDNDAAVQPTVVAHPASPAVPTHPVPQPRLGDAGIAHTLQVDAGAPTAKIDAESLDFLPPDRAR